RAALLLRGRGRTARGCELGRAGAARRPEVAVAEDRDGCTGARVVVRGRRVALRSPDEHVVAAARQDPRFVDCRATAGIGKRRGPSRRAFSERRLGGAEIHEGPITRERPVLARTAQDVIERALTGDLISGDDPECAAGAANQPEVLIDWTAHRLVASVGAGERAGDVKLTLAGGRRGAKVNCKD